MTTEIVLAEVHNVGCGKHQYRCTCEAPANHEHNHRCRCGGQWTGSEEDCDLVWHVRPGRAEPSPLDPHPAYNRFAVDSLFADFMRDYIDATYQQMMNTMLAEPPMFIYRPALQNYYIAGEALKEGALVKIEAGKVVNITVDIIDPPDYGRLIKQCEPPKALQSGEDRSDRRD